MDYTAIGEPVNVANRLQSLAGPGQIKITGEVRERLGELVDVKAEGTRMLEGVDHPIEVFEVLVLMGPGAGRPRATHTSLGFASLRAPRFALRLQDVLRRARLAG